MKVLYICTHNRCRSILAEAISHARAGDKLIARSAGSQPAGVVHPLSIKYLAAAGIPTQGLKSESWDAYRDFEPDLIITLCDTAAGETCPVWFGKATKLHWGLADPSRSDGDEAAVAAAFRQTIQTLSERVDTLATIAKLDGQARALAIRQLSTERQANSAV